MPVADTSDISSTADGDLHTGEEEERLDVTVLKRAKDKRQETTATKHLTPALSGMEDGTAEADTIEHVLTEIKSGAGELSLRIVGAWAREGQVHRLAKLADELLRQAESSTPSAKALDLMVEVAYFLGMVRPARASRLLEAVQTTDQWQSAKLESQLAEAQKWTQAGLLLEPCGMLERVLWNNRLRNPEMDWNWETPDARMALERLQNVLPGAPEAVLDLYRTAVPECWWDLFERTCLNEERSATRKAALPAPKTSTSRWKRGLRAAVLLVMGAALGGALTVCGIALRLVDLKPLESLQPQAEALAQIASTVSQSLPRTEAAPKAAPPAPAPVLSWRDQEKAAIQAEFPALERLHRTLATGTLKEATPILRGSSSIASLNSPGYRALLRWAMVEPPADAEVRRAVIRLFALTPPFSKVLPVLEKAAREGEPYHDEMKEMAGILLTAGQGASNADQVERLRLIAK